ncbi:MAG: preprotein translocase subunit SecG [Flavobacteriales bacterium]|nr:preprotein translocase subunit SecG [Flavobacteriales bacterium]
MFTLIIWLSIIASVLIIAIVLVQNPKGGGLSANFSAANQILGVNKTTEGVEKITWILAISLLILSLAGPFFLGGSGSGQESLMKDNIENANPAPATQGTPPPPPPSGSNP